MTDWRSARRGAVYTSTVLMTGLLVGIGAGAGIDALVSPRAVTLGRLLAALAAFGIISVAAHGWGRLVAHLQVGGGPLRASRAPALFVAAAIIVAAAALAAIEPAAVQRGQRLGVAVHGVYTVLFAVATLVVSGVGSYGLGRGLRDHQLGLQLARTAAPAATGGFLVMAALMYMFGWRVGAPHAAARATMLVVTGVGLLAAALASGAVIGSVLSTVPRAMPSTSPDVPPNYA